MLNTVYISYPSHERIMTMCFCICQRKGVKISISKYIIRLKVKCVIYVPWFHQRENIHFSIRFPVSSKICKTRHENKSHFLSIPHVSVIWFWKTWNIEHEFMNYFMILLKPQPSFTLMKVQILFNRWKKVQTWNNMMGK